MPSLAIQIDGERVATIDLTEMNVVDAAVHGGLDQEMKAVLHAMGGNYGDGGCGHLIWIGEKSLQAGQIVNILFTESCEFADKGQTIQELYPADDTEVPTDFSITDAMAAEIRARPRIHAAFTVRVETSNDKQATASSDESNTDYRVNVLWDWTRPDQARLRFGTYCLDDVLARQPGTVHLEDILSYGDSASFTLVE